MKTTRFASDSRNGQNLAQDGPLTSEKPITGKEAAAVLRAWHTMLSADEHRQIAARMETLRRRVAHEHLH